jgi:molybdopterin-containing oxidoreductase family membrane subunit
LGFGYYQLCLVGWYWSRGNLLISAVLLLFRQKWRMVLNRSAEVMDYFPVVQAGLFPLSTWSSMASLLLPTHQINLVPMANPNSPLLWDVFAISNFTFLSHWFSGGQVCFQIFQ